MAVFLLIVLLIIEIGFSVYGLTGAFKKNEWALRRLIAKAVQAVIFFLMVLLPGIDLSFRFYGLILILLIRIVFSLGKVVILRKNEGTEKKWMMILGTCFGVLLLTVSMIPAFFFADYHGRKTTGDYEVGERQAILIDPSRVEAFEDDGSHREVPVHFYFPVYEEEADAEAAAHSLPLVIFSHGAFGYYQSNTSTYMELASHGYVVVSLDHPYHSFFTKDSEGKTITVDPEFISTAMKLGGDDNPYSEEETFEISSKWMELRIADTGFVIDRLKEAATTGELTDDWFFTNDPEESIVKVMELADPERIGVMGHSLGGATAVSMGRRSDVKAVIDLDGTMIGEQTGVKDGQPVIKEEPYTTPLLAINSEKHEFEIIEAQKVSYSYANNVVLEHAEEGHETYIPGSDHMNFTDLPLFAPALAKMLGTGSVDAGECIDQTNALVLSFFDCYLKGEGNFTIAE